MAAVFPLDTTQPWTFNGVTYQYDATEDRWFVISTNKTDLVDETLEDLERGLDITNTVIDQEIENRTVLLNAAATKNNTQDASIDELSGRIDAIGSVVGVLEFKGRYNYVLEKTVEACTAAYAQCLLEAGGDVPAMSECNRLKDVCEAAVSDPYADGSFTSTGTTNVMEDVEEFVFSGVDLDGQSLDWINLVEPTDYIEFVEKTGGDTALYECIEEPKIASTERSIRVKFLKETGSGDGNFNLQEEYDIRVIKASTGIDIVEADKRYVQRPYKVIFASVAPTEGQAEDKVLHNGELWYDTSNLELFVWNNNSWVTATKPPSQDIVISSVIADVDRLLVDTAAQSQRINSLVNDLLLENNIYYSDDPPVGDITGTLRNGDLWVDSDDLTIKFYSQGAWINPDRQVGGDYLEKSGGLMTGDLSMEGGDEATGSNIYLQSNGYIRFGYGPAPAQQYGGYIFQRDENIFEIGAYNNKTLKFVGSPEFASSPQVPEPTDDAHATTKKYVDDSFNEWEWHSNSSGATSAYTVDAVHWTYIDTDTIKLNIAQDSLVGRSCNYPDAAHQAVEFPISITGLDPTGLTVPVLSGKTSSIRSLTFDGNKYFQVYVPIGNQFIWNPTAVSNLANVKVKIHGYL